MMYGNCCRGRKANGNRSAGRGFLLLCLLLFSFGALQAYAEGEDPVVVRVGQADYPLSLARFSLESSLDVARALEDSPREEDLEDLKESTIRRLVYIGVMENKLKELGRYDFTAEEEELLNSFARSQYQQAREALLAEMQKRDESFSEEDATRWLGDAGYTVDAFVREAEINERELRLIGEYCADVVLTESEVDTYYLENFVNPEKEKYGHNIPLYEEEVIMRQNESFYVPEGYRYLKHILLPYPEELVAALRPYARKMKEADSALEQAGKGLFEAAAAAEKWEDLAGARAVYDSAKAASGEALEAFEAKQREALDMVRETTDEISRRYAAGESFESLMKEFSQDTARQGAEDPGFPFHPDSPNWPESFRRAAAALAQPGDLSAPVLTDAGIHIIRYMADIPSGAHVLTEEERKALEASVLRHKQEESLRVLLDEWLKDYPVETHPELLTLPDPL